MRMIIVRHGESEWNRIHRYQGQADAPLSELGASQAADAIAVLTRSASSFPAIDLVWASARGVCSELPRPVAQPRTDLRD